MLKKWLTCLLLMPALLAPQIRAETDEPPRQFDIEVILFANLNAYDGGEAWPMEMLPEPPLPEFTDTVEPEILPGPAPDGATQVDASTAPLPDGTEPEEDKGWTLLPASEHKLDAIEGALRRSSGYRPLAHLLWRQTVLDLAAAMPIDILDLQAYSPDEPLPLPHVEGTLRVSVSRYLHMETDLRLVDTSPLPYTPSSMDSLSAGDREVPVYRMVQRRRMRSGELHYLDHPRFGMLVQITPYTPPEPEPEPTPEPAPEPAMVSPGETVAPEPAPVP